MLFDEYIRQGYSLLEATEQTKHLRSRDGSEPEEPAAPTAPSAVAPPPDMAAIAQLSRWNTVQ